MLWKGRRQSENIEDRRGGGGGGGPFGGRGGGMRLPIGRGAGGGGLSTIMILVVLFFVLRACGIDPLQISMAAAGRAFRAAAAQVTETSPPASDEMKQFVATVLAETEDVWNGIFQAEGLKYEEPKLMLFGRHRHSACGYAPRPRPGRSIARATARSISTPTSSTSSPTSSAPRAISRRPM